MLESTVGSIVGLLVLAIFLFTYAVIVRKAGFSPWWALLTLVPVVNLFALAFFTLSEWPIEKERQQHSPKP
jgi:uncharacterized membrane protein YhaH (DUF805 family)